MVEELFQVELDLVHDVLTSDRQLILNGDDEDLQQQLPKNRGIYCSSLRESPTYQ